MYFWPLMAHASATSKLQLMSSMVFLIISSNIPLYHSFNPLLHELSAAVVPTTAFKFSTMSLNNWLLNSLPLLVRIIPEVPKYAIQYLKMALMMSEFSLLGTLTPALYLVPWLIRCRTLLPLIFLDVHINAFIEIWS